MNSLPLSPVLFSYATLQGKPLPTSHAEVMSPEILNPQFRVGINFESGNF